MDRAIVCAHAPRDWVVSVCIGNSRMLVASALWDENESGVGNFGILDAGTEGRARVFAEGDPFATGGVVARIELTRLADTFPADRIRPMTGEQN